MNFGTHNINMVTAIALDAAVKKAVREGREQERRTQTGNWVEQNQDGCVEACRMLSQKQLTRFEIIKIVTRFYGLGLCEAKKLVETILKQESDQQRLHLLNAVTR